MNTPVGSPEVSLEIAERIAEVQERTAEAARSAGRDPSEIVLIGVAKKIPLPVVEAGVAAGLTHLSENYVQDAMVRLPHLRATYPFLTFHMTGALQRNKVRKAVELFDIIHTVDSPRLATSIALESQRRGIRQKILLQVNVSGEVQKSGVKPEETRALAELVLAEDHLELVGLMTIGESMATESRRHLEFSTLRELRNEVSRVLSIPLPHLSMGMSDDFELAVREGATMIRVGSALFGPRETQ